MKGQFFKRTVLEKLGVKMHYNEVTNSKCILKIKGKNRRKVVKQPQSLTTFPENLGLIPSTIMSAYNFLLLQFQSFPMPSSCFQSIIHTRETQADMQTTTHTHVIKLKHLTISVTVKVILKGQVVGKMAQNIGMNKTFLDMTSKA